MEYNALVFLWPNKGLDISPEVVTKMSQVLVQTGYCDLKDITVKYMDESEIAKATAAHTCSLVYAAKTPANNDEEAMKNALIYIANRFQKYLGNVVLFTVNLANAVSTAKQNISFTGVGSNTDALLNAVEIIATKRALVMPNFAKKHNLSQGIIDAIVTVYKSYQHVS